VINLSYIINYVIIIGVLEIARGILFDDINLSNE